jgi:hypothetical protein
MYNDFAEIEEEIINTLPQDDRDEDGQWYEHYDDDEKDDYIYIYIYIYIFVFIIYTYIYIYIYIYKDLTHGKVSIYKMLSTLMVGNQIIRHNTMKREDNNNEWVDKLEITTIV